MKQLPHCEPTITLPKRFVHGKIGVVTVTYNSSSVLEDFLASLDAQTYSNFVLIAVDSHSSDNSVERLNAYHGHESVIIVNEENVGIAIGNNQGIRAAIQSHCEYVMLLNNDVVFREELFDRLVQGIETEHSSMAVPMIYFFQPSNLIWAAGGGFEKMKGFRNYHRGEGKEDVGQFNQSCLIDFAPACCVLIRRDTFAQIGLMDERYFVYSDDADFMFRARKNKLRTSYIPDAKLWHKVSSLTGGLQSNFTIYHAARGRALFLYKNLGRFNGWLWFVITYLLYLIRPILGKDTKQRCSEKQRGLQDGRQMALMHKN
ncbi:MAG: glycosyltransferase family 2 protein [Silvibacterium sp.]